MHLWQVVSSYLLTCLVPRVHCLGLSLSGSSFLRILTLFMKLHRLSLMTLWLPKDLPSDAITLWVRRLTLRTWGDTNSQAPSWGSWKTLRKKAVSWEMPWESPLCCSDRILAMINLKCRRVYLCSGFLGFSSWLHDLQQHSASW